MNHPTNGFLLGICWVRSLIPDSHRSNYQVVECCLELPAWSTPGGIKVDDHWLSLDDLKIKH